MVPKEMGVESGPFTSATLKSQAGDGTITPETLVRRGLDGEWVSAHRIHGLFELPTGLVRADHAPLVRAKPLPADADVPVSAAEVETLPDFPAVIAAPNHAENSTKPSAESSLVVCADCHLLISRRAPACPHCGCPQATESASALATLKSATFKRSIVGTVLSVLGILGTLFFAFVYDTTVPSGGLGGQVHNLGLVATQLIGVLISLSFVVLGAMPTSLTFKYNEPK